MSFYQCFFWHQYQVDFRIALKIAEITSIPKRKESVSNFVTVTNFLRQLYNELHIWDIKICGFQAVRKSTYREFVSTRATEKKSIKSWTPRKCYILCVSVCFISSKIFTRLKKRNTKFRKYCNEKSSTGAWIKIS